MAYWLGILGIEKATRFALFSGMFGSLSGNRPRPCNLDHTTHVNIEVGADSTQAYPRKALPS